MDILQNSFHILTASSRDNRRRIMELADERSLLFDSSECVEARTQLSTPRKRLSAEVAWLPGIEPQRTKALLSLLESSPEALLAVDIPSSIARTNLLAAGLARLSDYSADEVVKWILEIAGAFDDTDPDQLKAIINETRLVSGFPQVSERAAIEAELQEQRRYYRHVIQSALETIAPKERLEALTVAVTSATNNGEEHGPVLITDLVDSYEVEAKEALDKEETRIKALVEKLRVAVDAMQPDSVLFPMTEQLIRIVKNWDSIAQPIQISTKSRGLDHDASYRVAGLVRGLSIHMFNAHGKIDFSQKLTKLLQEVFAEVREVAERSAEDADLLVGHSGISKIEALATQIKTDVDSGQADEQLLPKVDQLCRLVMNWAIDPGHDASQHIVGIIRDLATYIFNKHHKPDVARQFARTVLQAFGNFDAVPDRITGDIRILQEITTSQTKPLSSFREFDLNGNLFSFRDRIHSTNNIRHIGLYRSGTTHKSRLIKTRKKNQENIYLMMFGGEEVRIFADECRFLLNKEESEEFRTVAEVYSYLSHATFDRRLDFYESKIRRNGYFEYDKCYFYPRNKIICRRRGYNLSSTSFLRRYGHVEMRKKDYRAFEKMKRGFSLGKIAQFSTIIDTDVIFHLLDKHFRLNWDS